MVHSPLYPPTRLHCCTNATSGPRNRPRYAPSRSRHALAIASYSSITRGLGSFLGALVRRYESVRHPCEESHDHAEGYSACEEDSWCLGRSGLMTCDGDEEGVGEGAWGVLLP